MGDPERLLRIHAAAAEVGVAEPTLRAWERRYGVPCPIRTAAGYRLYDANALAMARSMKRLVDDGLAAAEAARAVRAGGIAPATEPVEPDAATVGHASAYEALRDALLSATARFDDEALSSKLRRLLFVGSPREVVDNVVVPVLHEVGRRWFEGEVSVAHEHLVSQHFGGFLRDLVRLTPAQDGSAAALLACFANDTHELGLLAVALRVSALGLRPVFLGARTPAAALASAVEALRPRLVALSVTVAPPRARGRELVDAYAVACGAVPWIVGGQGASAIADLVVAGGGEVVTDDAGLARAVRDACLGRDAGRPASQRRARRGRRGDP